MKKTKHNLR